MIKGNLENKVQIKTKNYNKKQKLPRGNHFQFLATFPLELLKINTNTHIHTLYLFTKLGTYYILIIFIFQNTMTA